MAKKSSKTTSLTPAVQEVTHFSNVAPRDIRLPKGFRAAVGLDSQRRPAWFLFDLIAFWELVCRIDERLFETLPDSKYESVSLGALIDTLEERWPFSGEYKEKLRREYERALRDIKAGKVRICSS